MSQADWENAFAHTDAGRLEEAERAWQCVLGADPANPFALAALGHVYCDLEQFDRSRMCLERALSIARTDEPSIIESILVALGITNYRAGRHAAAVEALQRAITLRPSAHAHVVLGCALRRLECQEQAICALRRATECDPSFDEAWMNLASCLIDIGSLEAILCAERAVELDPNCSINHYTLGRALFVLDGQQDRIALSHLQRAAALNPQEAWCWTYLGWVRERFGEQEEAAAVFERAVQLDPVEIEALLGLGRIRRRQRRMDESLACLRVARQIEPDSAEVMWELGLATLRHGARSEAMCLLNRAVELNPATYASGARRILDRLQAGDGPG
jgi:protein O-GlcNAc transferase